jgi:hypothetical protein
VIGIKEDSGLDIGMKKMIESCESGRRWVVFVDSERALLV